MVIQYLFGIGLALSKGLVVSGLKPDIVADEKQGSYPCDIEKVSHSLPLFLMSFRQSDSLTILILRALASGEGLPVLASNRTISGSAHQHKIPDSSSHAYPLPVPIFIFFFVFNFWIFIFSSLSDCCMAHHRKPVHAHTS